jgi:hypothetical protein
MGVDPRIGRGLAGAGCIDVAVLVYRQQHGGAHRAAMTGFLVWLGILVAVLIAVCFMTGERPRWRWGD